MKLLEENTEKHLYNIRREYIMKNHRKLFTLKMMEMEEGREGGL